MHWTSEHLQPTLIWLFEWYLEEKGKGGWSVGVPLSVPLLPPKGYLQPFIFLALEGKKETNIYWVGTQGRLVVVRNYCILIIHSFIPMLVMERHTSFLSSWRIHSRGMLGWGEEGQNEANKWRYKTIKQWGCLEDGHRELWWRSWAVSLYWVVSWDPQSRTQENRMWVRIHGKSVEKHFRWREHLSNEQKIACPYK